MEIETLVLLAYAIENSTDIFRIWGRGGLKTPNPPSRYATDLYLYLYMLVCMCKIKKIALFFCCY